MINVKMHYRGYEWQCPHCRNWNTDVHDIPKDGYIRCGFCRGLYTTQKPRLKMAYKGTFSGLMSKLNKYRC